MKTPRATTQIRTGLRLTSFRRTLEADDAKGVSIISEDAAEFVRKLKNEEGKDICVMGGGVLARSLFEADLIDEIGMNVHPVLLGSGIPLFHEMKKQIDLELVKCQQLKTGCGADVPGETLITSSKLPEEFDGARLA